MILITILLFFLLELSNSYANDDNKCYKKKWEHQILTLHNDYRDLHCVPHLEWDCDIAQSASDYAKYLCPKNELIVAEIKYGENYYMASYLPQDFNKTEIATNCINAWYNGYIHYDYNNPQFSLDSGTFTQVVWNDTQYLGCGLEVCEDKDTNTNTAIVVCYYCTPGNVKGKFDTEVMPLCKSP